MMKTENLKQLIEKFYDGDATSAEIDFITQYFSQKDIDEELVADKELFLLLNKPKASEIPDELLSQLDNAIDTLDAKQRKSKRTWLYCISAAASIILLFSIFLNINFNATSTTQFELSERDTFKEPEDAYKKTQQALLALSSRFNKGLTQLNYIDDEIDKTNRKLNKILK